MTKDCLLCGQRTVGERILCPGCMDEGQRLAPLMSGTIHSLDGIRLPESLRAQ